MFVLPQLYGALVIIIIVMLAMFWVCYDDTRHTGRPSLPRGNKHKVSFEGSLVPISVQENSDHTHRHTQNKKLWYREKQQSR